MTSIGSIGGGWLSSWMIQRGWSVNASRKVSLLVCALCVVPVFSVTMVSNLWAAVCLLGLATAAHSGFAANLFTIVSDTMPRKTVSSVIGIGGMFGAIGGMLVAKIVGYILEWSGNYLILFVGASLAYLCAVLIVHLLVPRMEPEKIA